MPKQKFSEVPTELAKQMYKNVKKNEEATCLQCNTSIGYYNLVGTTVKLNDNVMFCCEACAEEWMDSAEMPEFVIAIVLTGILNLGIIPVPIIASCSIAPSENNLTIQGNIRCNILVGNDFELSIIGMVTPLKPVLPDKNKQNYIYY